jgi:hypothetical protein
MLSQAGGRSGEAPGTAAQFLSLQLLTVEQATFTDQAIIHSDHADSKAACLAHTHVCASGFTVAGKANKTSQPAVIRPLQPALTWEVLSEH